MEVEIRQSECTVKALEKISRSGYVVIATKHVHRFFSMGMRQRTDRQADRHTEARDRYTFRVVYDSREK